LFIFNAEATPMTAAAQHRHQWMRVEYDRLVETGAFAPDYRLELLDGEIVEMPPQGPVRVTAVHLIADCLRPVLPAGCILRIQAPLALDDLSEPEPDICVVKGRVRDFADRHPTDALLIIEVSDTSLDYDRTAKASAYARNGIPEYWIIDLKRRAILVFADPSAEGYGQVRHVTGNGRVSSASVPGIDLDARELLP
jgi:Uma2 family endonuclease